MRIYFEAVTNEGVECGSVEASDLSEAQTKMESRLLGTNPNLRVSEVHFECVEELQIREQVMT